MGNGVAAGSGVGRGVGSTVPFGGCVEVGRVVDGCREPDGVAGCCACKLAAAAHDINIIADSKKSLGLLLEIVTDRFLEPIS